MKRLTGRKPLIASSLPEEIEKEELRWDEMEGFSGWFVYKISKYFSLGIYPEPPCKIEGRKLKARNRINLSKLSGRIGILVLSNIQKTKGVLGDFLIDTVCIRNTIITDDLWEIIRRARAVVLHDAHIVEYKEEAFANTQSIEILGSTVMNIGHRVIDLLNSKRKRVRIADSKVLIFWDVNKCSTCVLRHFDVYRIIQRIPSIRIIHFDSIEITMSIIKELRRHPIVKVKMIGCKIHPLKIYDLVATCRDTLREIEFIRTGVTLDIVDHLKKNKIAYTIS